MTYYCVNPDEFDNIEPGLFEAKEKKAKYANLKEAKRGKANSGYKKRNRENSAVSMEGIDEEDDSGFKLPLFNASRT